MGESSGAKLITPVLYLYLNFRLLIILSIWSGSPLIISGRGSLFIPFASFSEAEGYLFLKYQNYFEIHKSSNIYTLSIFDK